MLWSERVVWTDEKGIYGGYWNGRRRRIPWTALESIGGGVFDQTLTLRGGGQTIKFDPYYRDFAWLIEVARRARPELWRRTDRREFRRSHGVDALLLLLAVVPWALLGWSWWSGTGGGWWLWALLLLFGVFMIYASLARPYHLRIEGDALRLRYPLRQRVIPATEIARVEATEQAGMLGVFPGYEVRLLLADGRCIPLNGFGGGIGEFGNTLIAWHQRTMQDEPVVPLRARRRGLL